MPLFFFRPPQLALLLSTLALAAAMAAPRAPRWLLRLLALGCSAALLWHSVAMLVYWQIGGAVLGASLLLMSLLRSAPGGRRRGRVALAGARLTLLSGAALAVLPLFQLPEPTGPNPVGVRLVTIADPERADAAFPGGHRELRVQVWYPAAAARGPLARYRTWRETTLLSSYQAALPTHAHVEAPVAQQAGGFPVLLFNSAWGGQRTQSTFLTEELASHGFVVAAIDHTHNSALVAFPGGPALPSTEPHAVDDFDSRSLAQVLAFANEEIATEVADDRLVLAQLARWSQEKGSPWEGRVDANRAGAMGHSFGGAVAVAAAAAEPRIRGAFNMDGWMFGALDGAAGKPLFDINSGTWPFSAEEVARERRSTSMSDRLDVRDLDRMLARLPETGGYLLALPGTLHTNFTDRPLYSPLRRETEAGTRDPAEVHRMLRAYAVAFFSQLLCGTSEPLLTQGTAAFPGTFFRAWPLPGPAQTKERAQPKPRP